MAEQRITAGQARIALKHLARQWALLLLKNNSRAELF